MVEDCAAGIEGSEACRDGEPGVGLAFRDRVGLAELRESSGVAGAGVLDLIGSSTMYIGVSRSRNSVCYISMRHYPIRRNSDIPSAFGTPAMISS